MIILIGFKNVGKSSIGLELAHQMHCSFVDLDEVIEEVYAKHANALVGADPCARPFRLSCREIVRLHGESYFRDLEKSVFAEILSEKPAVLSLGGGTVMDTDNQALLKGHGVIHITAPYELVFERIMSQGLPSFFPENESPRTSFDRLWHERSVVYNQLASFSIDNDATIESAVKKILNYNKTRESS
jgi:shikimate kinase